MLQVNRGDFFAFLWQKVHKKRNFSLPLQVEYKTKQ